MKKPAKPTKPPKPIKRHLSKETVRRVSIEPPFLKPHIYMEGDENGDILDEWIEIPVSEVESQNKNTYVEWQGVPMKFSDLEAFIPKDIPKDQVFLELSTRESEYSGTLFQGFYLYYDVAVDQDAFNKEKAQIEEQFKKDKEKYDADLKKYEIDLAEYEVKVREFEIAQAELKLKVDREKLEKLKKSKS